jgi:redox-sensitive bicupin YhaK (pirin superfamily)
LYVAEGQIEVSGVQAGEGGLIIFSSGHAVTASARRTSRVILLGGERFATPRFIWWNFVASSLERIEMAKRDWAANRYPPVPGETEFIPLPAD